MITVCLEQSEFFEGAAAAAQVAEICDWDPGPWPLSTSFSQGTDKQCGITQGTKLAG